MQFLLNWALVGAVAVLYFAVFEIRDTGMEMCQLSHSYDVCFQVLNR